MRSSSCLESLGASVVTCVAGTLDEKRRLFERQSLPQVGVKTVKNFARGVKNLCVVAGHLAGRSGSPPKLHDLEGRRAGQ